MVKCESQKSTSAIILGRREYIYIYIYISKIHLVAIKLVLVVSTNTSMVLG
jgi:hypothetical protein